MDNAVNAIRVVLGSKKVVMLREPKIRDQEMAMQVAASKSKDNAFLLATKSNAELLKILLLEVDGRPIARSECEQLDALFSLAEFNQLQQVVGQLSGGTDMGEFQIEHATSGGK